MTTGNYIDSATGMSKFQYFDVETATLFTSDDAIDFAVGGLIAIVNKQMNEYFPNCVEDDGSSKVVMMIIYAINKFVVDYETTDSYSGLFKVVCNMYSEL